MPDKDANAGRATESAAEEQSSLGLGERLRSARTARALSVDDVCEKLHLDEVVVNALEEERFADLGAPVFVRGHLRSYAALLGLSADKLIASYESTIPQATELPAAPLHPDRSVTVNPVTWGFWGMVVLLALALVIYVFSGDEEANEAAAEELRSEAPIQDDAPAPPSASGRIALPPDAQARPDPEPEAGPEPVGQAVDQPVEPADAPGLSAAATEDVELALVFRGESWAEISDVRRRLLFGLQRPGTRREVAGEPPFRLLLGNATQVELFVNSEPYAIPDERSANDVARFIIDPPAGR